LIFFNVLDKTNVIIFSPQRHKEKGQVWRVAKNTKGFRENTFVFLTSHAHQNSFVPL